MHIVVMGAGAVGGYFGGRLAAAGHPVTFLVRESRYETLQRTGLIVHSSQGNFSLTPKLARSAAEITQPDVVVVALKNYHLQAAMPELRALVSKGAKILPLLNGVQHIDTLTAEFGHESVWGGVCYIESTLGPDGSIIHTSPMHDIIFGTLAQADHPLLQTLTTAFEQAGVPARVSSAILVDMWQKFIFLTSFSGITAATRKSIGEVRKDSVAFSFLQEMVAEIVHLANCKQIPLPVDAYEQTVAKISSMPEAMTSSLHRDLEKGRPLEIDSLQGAVTAMAAECGIETPCVKSVYALLHPHQ